MRNMREKFLKYAEQLYSGENCEKIYTDLSTIFKEAGLFHEAGACLEKLWHITQNGELYKEIGDIFLDKVKNRDVALAAYNRYLKSILPDFYSKYANNLNRMGYSNFNNEVDNEDYSREIIRLCDNYDTVVFMMLYLHKNKDYQTILDLRSYLNKVTSDIENYKIKYPMEDYSCTGEVVETKKHLVEVLATTKHHNDLNRFIIEIAPMCQQAYINILGDLIVYKKYEDALNLYCNEYAKKFDKCYTDSISQISWEISDYYRDKFDFYEAVKFQKCALEYDLSEQGI